MNELKPCPFCGGNYANIRPLTHQVLDSTLYYVYCDECGASTAACLTMEDAADHWNERKYHESEND